SRLKPDFSPVGWMEHGKCDVAVGSASRLLKHESCQKLNTRVRNPPCPFALLHPPYELVKNPGYASWNITVQVRKTWVVFGRVNKVVAAWDSLRHRMSGCLASSQAHSSSKFKSAEVRCSCAQPRQSGG